MLIFPSSPFRLHQTISFFSLKTFLHNFILASSQEHPHIVNMSAKINSTYSGGYYLPHDFDAQKLAKQRRQEQLETFRKRGRDEETRPTIRQTMMLPFGMVCEHCSSNLARGIKLYANVKRLDEKYLGKARIFMLSFRCPKCSGVIAIKTDPASRDYVVVSGAQRIRGDWGQQRQQEQELTKEEQAKAQELSAADASERQLRIGQQAAEDAQKLDVVLQDANRRRNFLLGEATPVVVDKGRSDAEYDSLLQNMEDACGSEPVEEAEPPLEDQEIAKTTKAPLDVLAHVAKFQRVLLQSKPKPSATPRVPHQSLPRRLSVAVVHCFLAFKTTDHWLSLWILCGFSFAFIFHFISK